MHLGIDNTGRRGFVLIELVVIVSILAILAALLMPVYAQARARARATRCLGNVRQLAMATMLYSQDHDGGFPAQRDNIVAYYADPPDGPLPACAVGKGGADRSSWASGLSAYGADASLLVCPASEGYRCMQADIARRDDAGVPTPRSRVTYFYNGLATAGVEAGLIRPATQVSQVPRPTELALFSEWGGYATSASILSPMYVNGYWTLVSTGPKEPHQGGTNLGFADGHSRFVSRSELLRGCDPNGMVIVSNQVGKCPSWFNPYKD
jgi:prepilin-type processing-associated H-X9-DG protein